MEHTTPKPPALSPLETELLGLVNEFTSLVKELQSRVAQLETSVKADSATAQAQRKIIDDKLQDLGKRLSSLELSLTVSSACLTAFDKQFLDLAGLFATHKMNYNKLIAAFRETQKACLVHEEECRTLRSQVVQLTAALRSLGA